MKFKIGFRVGSGFALLLIIAGMIGGLALWRMSEVEVNTAMLQDEYTPEVRIANSIERSVMTTMQYVRGYEVSGDEAILSSVDSSIARTRALIGEGNTLAEQSPHLLKLPGALQEVAALLVEYEQLVGRTRQFFADMLQNREQLSSAARNYTENCAEYLNAEMGSMEWEIAELDDAEELLLQRLKRVSLLNGIIELGNRMQSLAWRFQVEHDQVLIQQVRADLDAGRALFEGLAQLTVQDRFLEKMRLSREAADAFGQALDGYFENWTAGKQLAVKRNAISARLLETVTGLADAGMGHARTVTEDTVQSLERAAWFMVVGLMLALAVGCVVAVLLTRSITVPVRKAVTLALDVAAGDFSQRLDLKRSDEIGELAAALDSMAGGLQKNAELADQIASGNLDVEVELTSERDQLGQALRNMTESLNTTLGRVMAVSEQVATGSAQVSDASHSLSQGATESASSLEEITSSMTEMSSQTKRSAENSGQASSLAAEARQAAENGNSRMQDMVAAMSEINEAGQSIGRIIKVIDEIAFQTNLLALNAAVEAARAGQHGKGFAVVAEEVRNLAARSARAASETAELIEGSVQKAENGVGIANRTADALQEIVSGISHAADLVGEIAAASSEQAQGIAEVNLGLGQIDQVTQQNTANAEQSAAAAQELSGQAEELQGLLSGFRLKKPELSSLSKGDERDMLPAISREWGGAMERKSDLVRPDEIIAVSDEEFSRY